MTDKTADKTKTAPKVREAEPGEFPKMLYFKGNVGKTKVVNSVQEEDNLGEDWVDAPSDAPDA